MQKTLKAGIGVTLATAVVGALVLIPLSANAAPPAPADTDNPLYLLDGLTGVPFAEDQVLNYDTDLILSSDLDYNIGTYPAPAGTLNAYAFLSHRGTGAHDGPEFDKDEWSAFTIIGTSTDLLPTLNRPGALTSGNPGVTPGSTIAAAAAGGDYSYGVAFVNAAGDVLEANFVYITVTPGLVSTASFVASGGSVEPPAPPVGDFEVDVTAEVEATADGALTLVAPGTATTGTTLAHTGFTDGTYGLSVSEGELGEFTVRDNRYTIPGVWNLTVDVDDFVNGGNTITKDNFGVAPVLVAPKTGVTLDAEQAVGAAVYAAPFAHAAAGTTGDTLLNADLTLIAPAGTPAGDYTSTVTVTLDGGD